MYNILEVLWDVSKDLEEISFTTQEVSILTGFSKDTIANNLNRLVKVGLLERHEYWEPHTEASYGKPRGCSRQVKYTIRKDMYEFINNTLFG